MTGLTRRRFIAISAASLAGGISAAGAAKSTVWRGIALGAEAEIRLDTGDPAGARAVIDSCRLEIARLEKLFSLYRTDSAIARLNRDGAVDNPDPDFLALLSLARSVHRNTGGLFDPTVQPVWSAYAERRPVQGHIGFDAVSIARDRVAFDRPGMAITLNGIAQGFITDRVASLLRGRGLRHVLVDMGELRALDGRRDGSGWPVRIAGSPAKTIRLRDRALATSAPLGTTFDQAGRLGHIIDPRTGRPMTGGRAVTVEAKTAAIADALSTAFCLMPEPASRQALRRYPDARLV